MPKRTHIAQAALGLALLAFLCLGARAATNNGTLYAECRRDGGVPIMSGAADEVVLCLASIAVMWESDRR